MLKKSDWLFTELNVTSVDQMRNILSGEIKFYAGWKIREGKGIKAPNLHPTNGTGHSNINLGGMVDIETEKEITQMLKNIKNKNEEGET